MKDYLLNSTEMHIQTPMWTVHSMVLKMSQIQMLQNHLTTYISMASYQSNYSSYTQAYHEETNIFYEQEKY